MKVINFRDPVSHTDAFGTSFVQYKDKFGHFVAIADVDDPIHYENLSGYTVITDAYFARLDFTLVTD